MKWNDVTSTAACGLEQEDNVMKRAINSPRKAQVLIVQIMINRGMANCSRTDHKAQEHDGNNTNSSSGLYHSTYLLPCYGLLVGLLQQRNLHLEIPLWFLCSSRTKKLTGTEKIDINPINYSIILQFQLDLQSVPSSTSSPSLMGDDKKSLQEPVSEFSSDWKLARRMR